MFSQNTTVSGNRGRGSGGIDNGFRATLHLQNVTVASNTARALDNPIHGAGGGLGNQDLGVVTLKNTIVGGQRRRLRVGPDCLAFAGRNGALASVGCSLIQNVVNCDILGDSTGNVSGQDPHLGALTKNGRPTPTHALADGSPAIEAGSPAPPGGGGAAACAATDQRGLGPWARAATSALRAGRGVRRCGSPAGAGRRQRTVSLLIWAAASRAAPPPR